MFDNVRLPIDVERGAEGGPGFRTTIITLSSGSEQRNKEWQITKGQYNIGYGIRNRDDLDAVYDFFMARNGMFRAFRFRDWLDYTLEGEPMAPVDGEGFERFRQIVKTYPDTISPYTRPIRAPDMTTGKVYVNGLETTNYSYLGGGIVAFDTDPGPNVHFTGEFDIIARFDIDNLNVVLNTFMEGAIPQIPIVEIKLDTFDFLENGAFLVSNMSEADTVGIDATVTEGINGTLLVSMADGPTTTSTAFQDTPELAFPFYNVGDWGIAPGVITVPENVSLVDIIGGVRLTSNAAAFGIDIEIRVNGSPVGGHQFRNVATGFGDNSLFAMPARTPVAPGDQITLHWRKSTSTAMGLVSSPETFLNVVRAA